jgi:CXXX repeat radical SAM target protein
MEEKNKREEIQSRREFFKKAAKAALPVVGAAILSSVPFMNAEAVTGCEFGCTTSCSGGCYGECKGTCQQGCYFGCRNTCDGTCSGGCARSQYA